MPIPKRVREAVMDRDGGCLRCGSDRWQVAGLNAHHRKGRLGAGANDPANLVILCGSGTTGCHGWVHANPAEAYRTGWLVRRLGADDPAAIPVLDLMGHWWLVGEALTPFVAAAVPTSAAASPPVGPSGGLGPTTHDVPETRRGEVQ